LRGLKEVEERGEEGKRGAKDLLLTRNGSVEEGSRWRCRLGLSRGEVVV
jgi:hypothetical protein